MNDACLVYDGRLVIDESFHTNDVAIRAAGPLTKFQRRYYTQLTHADFSSKEIGVQVSCRSETRDANVYERVEFVSLAVWNEVTSVIAHLDLSLV